MEIAEIITNFSSTYEKVNKPDCLQPSGCNGPLVLGMCTFTNTSRSGCYLQNYRLVICYDAKN